MKRVCCITGNQWITGSEMIYIEKLLEQDANLGLCVCWEVLDILCVFFMNLPENLERYFLSLSLRQNSIASLRVSIFKIKVDMLEICQISLT